MNDDTIYFSHHLIDSIKSYFDPMGIKRVGLKEETFLKNEIFNLTPLEIQVIHLTFWKSKRPADIAADLSISRDDCEKLLEDAIAKIRESYFTKLADFNPRRKVSAINRLALKMY